MGKVLVKTKETVGEASYETEYVFETFEDFFVFEQYKEGLAQEMAERIKKNAEEGVSMMFEVKKKDFVH